MPGHPADLFLECLGREPGFAPRAFVVEMSDRGTRPMATQSYTEYGVHTRSYTDQMHWRCLCPI